MHLPKIFIEMPTMLKYNYLLTGLSGGVFFGNVKYVLIERLFSKPYNNEYPINYN